MVGHSGEEWWRNKFNRVILTQTLTWSQLLSENNPSPPTALVKVTRKAVMFLGEFEHTIDQKGRLAIPAKFRAPMASGAVVTRGIDRCLTLYPRSVWEDLASRIADLPITEPNARSFARLMLAGAMDVEADKQGRIILPAYLRHYAQIHVAVIVAGLYNRIEIWDKETWLKDSQEAQTNSSDIAGRLENLGFSSRL